MNSTCMISVGVMGYNQEKYVRQAMDSILAQQCSYPFEIVVSDDDSKDNTRAILEEYQQKHPGLIRLLPKAPNKGVLKNYASVIAACRGKYIAFCHCDDFWHDPLKLQKQVDFMEKNPDYGVVHTDANFFLDGSKTTIYSYRQKNFSTIPEGDVFEALLLGKLSITTPTALFSKAAMDKYVDLEEFVRAGFMYEDLPTWLALSRHTKIKFLPEATATYRVLENSHSHPKNADQKFRLQEWHYNMKKYFIGKYNVPANIERQFELQFHLKRFNLAYKWGRLDRAMESVPVLKEQNAMTSKLRLKLLFLQLPFLHRTLKNIKNIYLPKTSVSRL